MFRKLIRERRCLIPANCYYGWKEMPVGKRPYCIRMEDESPFFIGGMWAQLAISRLQDSPRGTLKVSASIAFGSTRLPPIVSELMRRHPELAVELSLEDRHVDLVREGIDVAVRIMVDAPDSGLVFRRLAPNRQVVCAGPSYIQRRGLPRTL